MLVIVVMVWYVACDDDDDDNGLYNTCSIDHTFDFIITDGCLLFYIKFVFIYRPKGGYEAKFTLAPIAPRLSELLNKNVLLVPDCRGISVGMFMT